MEACCHGDSSSREGERERESRSGGQIEGDGERETGNGERGEERR